MKLKGSQLRAISQLEKALANMKRYNLVLCAMDDSLLAFDATALKEAGYDDEPIEAMKALGQGELVEDSGVYLDSGGW